MTRKMTETQYVASRHPNYIAGPRGVVLEPPVLAHVFSQSALGKGTVELHSVTSSDGAELTCVWRATRVVVNERGDGTAAYWHHESGERRIAASYREARKAYRLETVEDEDDE